MEGRGWRVGVNEGVDNMQQGVCSACAFDPN